MTTRTVAVLGRLWATAMTVAILWAVLLVCFAPAWRTAWDDPGWIFLLALLTFGPLAAVVWLRWLFRSR